MARSPGLGRARGAGMARRTVAELEALLAERDRVLAEREREQAATTEVLAAISRSPTDLQGVLDTIVGSAARLSGSDTSVLFRVDGDTYRPVARATTQRESALQATLAT